MTVPGNSAVLFSVRDQTLKMHNAVQLNGGGKVKTMSGFSITLGTAFLLACISLCANAADVEMNGNASVSGTLNAGSFSGSAAGLTNIPGGAIANTSITVNQLANSAVTAEKLADAAVTSQKIAFFGKVAIVAPNGGDYSNPATAMSDYATWCGTPSATNTCLLKIMPGVYDVGTSTVVMQNYIDIEGSGENATTITGNVDSGTAGVVNGASNAEIRFITLKHTGGGTYAYAIYNSGASIKITNVTAMASGATWNYGITMTASSTPRILNATVTASGGTGSYAIMNGDHSSATLTNVTTMASGSSGSNIGLYNHTASATLMNVTATGTGGTLAVGVNNYAGSGSYTVRINNSRISGTSYSISAVQPYFTTLVGSSELGGGSAAGATCAGVYNSNYTNLYTGSCP